MTAVAVNCFVNDARRKFVAGVIGPRLRKSVTPYPLRKTALSLFTTRTAQPGSRGVIDFDNRASTCAANVCADAQEDSPSHRSGIMSLGSNSIVHEGKSAPLRRP